MTTAERILLVVEDSDEDFNAFQRALRQVASVPTIHRCNNGDDCLDYLYRTGKYAGTRTKTKPSLILLDLNLPGTDGREVLEQVKHDPALEPIPITVVTTSNNPKDVETCYQNGANSYIIKSVNFEKFQQTVCLLMDYWFGAVTLPCV